MNTLLCFLDKKSYQKISVVNYIIESQNPALEQKTLAKELHMSVYLLNKLMADINMDLKEVFPGATLDIDHGEIYIDSQLKYGAENLLLKKYFQKSASEKLLSNYLKNDEIIFNERIRSYGWSRSFFFKEKKQFEQKLIQFIGFNPSEKTIRMFIYGVYTYFNVTPNLPVPQLDALMESVLRSSIPRIENELAFQQKIRLLTIITYYRNLHHHHLTDDGLWLEKLPESPEIIATYKTVVSENTTRSAIFIFQTALEEGLVESNNYPLNKLVRNKNSWRVVSSIIHQFINDQPNKFNTREIFNLTCEVYVEIQRNDLLIDRNFSLADNLFSSVYPSISRNIKKLVRMITDQLPISDHHASYLYFRLVILIMSSNFSCTEDEYIEVCISFSTGARTNKWVARNVNDYQYLNIKTTHQLSENTDIYLSDVPLDDFDKPQVIWNRPTCAQSWYDLEDLMRLTKQKKYSL